MQTQTFRKSFKEKPASMLILCYVVFSAVAYFFASYGGKVNDLFAGYCFISLCIGVYSGILGAKSVRCIFVVGLLSCLTGGIATFGSVLLQSPNEKWDGLHWFFIQPVISFTVSYCFGWLIARDDQKRKDKYDFYSR